jgi:AraC-like DNA-binding protein
MNPRKTPDLIDMIAWDGPFCPFVHAADMQPRRHRWEIPQRRLAHYLLVTSLDGDEAIAVAGEGYRVPEGGSYLIQPGDLHDLGAERGSRPAWIHFDLRFDPNRRDHPHAGAFEAELGDRAPFLQPRCPEVFGVDLPVLAPPSIARLAREAVPRLIETWKRGSRLDVLAATHQLTGLLLTWVEHAWQASGSEPVLAVEARLARAEAAALRSLDTDFGVEDFALAAGLSRSRFCAVFAAHRGINPGGWLRRERLRRAEQLLERGDLPVARVGALVGYGDPTVFGRVFRAHAGMPPGAWKARIR